VEERYKRRRWKSFESFVLLLNVYVCTVGSLFLGHGYNGEVGEVEVPLTIKFSVLIGYANHVDQSNHAKTHDI
jgi:hypothetical protein